MLIIGHRGAMDLAPENTLLSIRTALESGVHMVEIDVALCRSGELMLMHDDEVDRTTDGTGCIADLSYHELKALNAGEGEVIPSLQEVIDLIDGRCPLNIEIKGKGSSDELVKILQREIREKGRVKDDFIVSSFDHCELNRFAKLYSGIRVSPIVCCHPLSLAELAEEIGAWSLNIKREFVSREIVEDAHKRGIKVLVFTVNRPYELEKLKGIGVDGVFTNNRYRLLGLS